MPGKCAVLSLQQQAISSAGMLLVESAKCMIKYANLDKVDSQLKRAKIISLEQEVRQYFNSVIPRHFQTKISLFWWKMLVCKKEYKHLHYSKGYKHLNYLYDNLVKLLAETMLNVTDLSDVSFCDFPYSMDETLFRHLPCMRNLQYLNIRGSHIEFPRCADLFNQEVLNMPNLLEFVFENCTDSIIERIAFNCKRIRKIDVTDSKQVTNACIPALCLCEDLQEFHCFYTAITRRGYESLLIYHPRLHTLDLIFLEDCIEDSEEHYFESSMIFMKNKTLNTENLRELSRMHPHIIWLRISLRVRNHLSILRWFPNVQIGEIMWYDCEHNFNDLHDVLKVRGSTITSLYFDAPDIDTNTLFIINQYCPNIINLSFTRTVIEYTVPIEEMRSGRFKPFQSVLYINASILCTNTITAKQFIKDLFSYSINVKSLFVNGVDFDDELLQEILILNPMKQLEQLKLVKTHLTMNSVNLLMEHCDSLCYLSELDTWNIEYEEVSNFILHLKRNNIQLLIRYDNDKDMDQIQNAFYALNSYF